MINEITSFQKRKFTEETAELHFPTDFLSLADFSRKNVADQKNLVTWLAVSGSSKYVLAVPIATWAAGRLGYP